MANIIRSKTVKSMEDMNETTFFIFNKSDKATIKKMTMISASEKMIEEYIN